MKASILRVLYILSLFILLAIVMYLYISNRQLTKERQEAVSAIAASFSHLTLALNTLSVPKSSSPQVVAEEIKSALIPLSLAAISRGTDVPAMSAKSFEGMCALVANTDRFFPIDAKEASSLDLQVNRLLNSRLHSLQSEIRNESTRRALRPGDRHNCQLQGTAANRN
jgi:hypothetical protein